MRRHKRELHLETKQQRVVIKGWDCGVSPVRVLEVFPAASKVEAAYRRSDGLQGTLVVCFRREADALAARGWHDTAGGVVRAVGAYSMRMVSCEQRVVRAWWREGSHWRQQQ